MKNLSEQFTADLNQLFFLREYSFGKNQFRAALSGRQLELADHVIALPDALLIFQIKGRDSGAATDIASVEKWFHQKVLKKGCGQIADSLRFLRDQPSLILTNERGHPHDLASARELVIPILLYSSGGALPEGLRTKKHHISKRAGFVHVLNI